MTVTVLAQSKPVALRDITVTPSDNSATITFLVTDAVTTVVVEPKENGVAEVRMKSMSAEKTALESARLKPGVRGVKAHIERVDVLVTDVTFTRTVDQMQVIHRGNDKVVVLVTLGSSADSHTEHITGSTTDRLQRDREHRWSLTTIVIDAGHGGRDPGTMGIDSIKEKGITLAVSKKLKEELEKAMPGVKVVMTRDKDEFIELDKRGEIANKSGGRLFISIHCNAMPEKPHPRSGFECYILRPGKSEDAARVAAAENDVIKYEAAREKYDRWEAEIVIMAGLAQNAFARYSEEAADAIRTSLRKSSGLPDRGVHQAGFYVLIGAAMPAVLIELGYLTNQKDVKALTNAWVQRKIARSIATGIRNYERKYQASLR